MPERISGVEWNVWQLRVATEAAGVALWAWNVDTDVFNMDDRAYALWGVPDTGGITFEELSRRIHPEDLDKVRASFASTRDIVGAYEIEFRILHDGHVKWISARGRGDEQGIVGRVMFGIFIDVSTRKLAEEAREMIAGEMNHRIKNLFAIAMGLTGISARATTTKEEMTLDLTRRFSALAAAHDLVRLDMSEQRKAAPIGDLVDSLLKPYYDEGAKDQRIRVDLPDILVGENSATALAMIVHELATNSIKYGALSAPTGRLSLSCADEGADIVLIWTETGGPAFCEQEGRSGFGGRLVSQSVTHQLGGSLNMEARSDGLVITLKANKARLGA